MTDFNRPINIAILIILTIPEFLFSQTLTLGDALDNTNVEWITAYDADWFPVRSPSHDGIDAGQSGTIDDDQSSAIGALFIGPGKLSFWWRVSSEPNADFLSLFINGEMIDAISGETGWLHKEVLLPAGTNLVFWEYSKDFVLAEGLDAGWLDEVAFIPDVVKPPILNIEKVNSNVRLSWKNEGKSFTIEETDNLVNGVWNRVSLQLNTNQNIIYAVIGDLSGQKKFYRLKLQ